MWLCPDERSAGVSSLGFPMRAWPGRGRVRRSAATGFVAVALCGLLLIPAPASPPPGPATERPFEWNQDDLWLTLEQRFRDASALGCERLREPIDARIRRGDRLLAEFATRSIGPEASILDSIEYNTFQLAPLIAGCIHRLPEYVSLVTRMRSVVKRQSERWDMNVSKDRLYQLLWGGRAALEEVMLQAPPEAVPALVLGDDEPSATPSTQMLGVTIHSGDMLVSRGGSATAALIAVGNDYQGNFSHVALVHVNEETGLATVIYSDRHGLQRSTMEDYLNDVKLRVMVLRLRADLPQIAADPMLPHEAAAIMLERARRGHTPYDFEIDHGDDSRMYCSEVPAWAYQQVGIRLWMEISHVSAPGTRRWLAHLGVKRFDMQEPSDLEYDPQLRVVAEWRDPHTLYLDHVDIVVTEAMLEGAAQGDRLTYAWYVLPFMRLLKGYSVLMNAMGRPGPVPEGMNSTVAARILRLNRQHAAIKSRALALAEEFRSREGYTPPEWQLVRLAQQAAAELE